MFKFDIFTDSGANLPDKFVKEYGIKVIPYSCTVNGKERLCYEKDNAFKQTATAFYNDMRAGADVKTSLIGLDRIEEYVTPTLESGRDAMIFTISSGISGTNSQARAAKEELEKKFPNNKVYVCDTANASMGSGMQVLKAARNREAGMTAAECAKYFQDHVYNYNSLATVDDLKYLRKGGRVSTVAAVAGTLLNIKPVLWANETAPAKLTVLTKERGRKKAFLTMVERLFETIDEADDQPIVITHTDCLNDAKDLAELLKARCDKEIIFEYYDLCTGAHVGPGTVALFYYGKDRRDIVNESKKGLPLFKNRKSENV